MIVFKISGYDEKKKERILKISVEAMKTSIVYDDDKGMSVNLYTDKFIRDLDSYRDNFGDGEEYLSRAIFKNLSKYTNQRFFVLLFRAFAASSRPLELRADSYSPKERETFFEKVDDGFDGKPYIDWTGSLQRQPFVFFVKKDFLQERRSQLERLYERMLLQKYKIEFEKETREYYFIPLKVPHVSNYKIIRDHTTWYEIVTTANEALERLS